MADSSFVVAVSRLVDQVGVGSFYWALLPVSVLCGLSHSSAERKMGTEEDLRLHIVAV